MSTLSLKPTGSPRIVPPTSRPASAASHNAWIVENPPGNVSEGIGRVSTPVQYLSPHRGTSAASIQDEAADVDREREREPQVPRKTSGASRPTTPSTMRATSPKPSSRSVSPSSLSHKLKNNAVVPTDEDLPKQQPRGKPVPIEAWPESIDQNTSESPAGDEPTSHRTRSPGEGSHMGSIPSMHSVISVKEAATDKRVDGMSLRGRVTPTGRQGQGSTTGTRNNDDTRSLVSRSSTRMAPPQIAKQQQAYIPYVMARDTISKVVEDMKSMKRKHIDIVHKIQEANNKIENETQSQFNVFVIGLRGQYKEKVKTFKQVISLHQQDLDRMKSYWQASLTSLNEKNKELMKEKQQLLLMNRTEAEKFRKEKEELMTDLTKRLDDEEKVKSRTAKHLQEAELSWEHEKKILEDKLATEENTVKAREAEIARLQRQLEEGETVPLVSSPGLADLGGTPSGNSAISSVTAATTTAAVVGNAEGIRLKAENDAMQGRMIELQKEHAVLQARYAHLEKQFNSVALLAQKDAEGISVQMADVNGDLDLLRGDGGNIKEEITIWEDNFKEENGRDAMEDDRTENIQELHLQLGEVQEKETNLQSQLDMLANLKEGKAPEPKQSVIPEPIVRTVQITVVDPTIAAELESTKSDNDQLQGDLARLREELRDAKKSVRRLEKEHAANQPTENSVDSANAVLVLQAILNQMNKTEVSSGSKEIKPDLESQLEETREEKLQLNEKQQEYKGKIQSWIQGFEETNGRAPESDDRNEEIQSLYQSLQENNAKRVSLEAEMMALTMMSSGEMPKDFEQVSTSQVLVDATADPDTIKVLQERVSALEEELEELRDQNSALEDDLKETRVEKQSLEEQISQSGGWRETVALTSTADFSYDDYDEDDTEGFGMQLNNLRRQQDDLQKQLEEERGAHARTKEELERTEEELKQVQQRGVTEAEDNEGKTKAANSALLAQIALLEKSTDEAKQRIDELEKEKLNEIPADTAEEIRKLQAKLKKSEKERDEHQKAVIQKTSDADKMRVDLETTQKSLAKEREINRGHQDTLKKKLAEKDRQAKEMVASAEKKHAARDEEKQKQIKTLEKKLKEAKVTGGAGGVAAVKGAANKVDAKTERKITMMQDHINNLKKQVEQEKNTIKQLEKDLREAKADTAADKQAGKKTEKQLKDLEKKLETETKKFEREQKKATELDAQLKTVTKERDGHADEIKKLQLQIDSLGVAAKEALELQEKCDEMQEELKELRTETKTLAENYNSERILRKKYYNMVEDMKGKIRVYCRARPLSGTEKERGNFEIIKAPDEYSIEIESNRGNKEFQFDHIFMPEASQEDVFEDTNNLVQSAVDGYNVCIFAYGQTGSGKTFTMIGDRDQNFPGIAPRAFQKIFDVIEENRNKFSFKVYTYMCELYNERLIDLYAKGQSEEGRLDIKKDKKGMVFIQGAVLQEATNSKELNGLFEQGSENRHVASTKMNAESSRSHLILAIVIESTNLATGSITRGKLSLVDLAGSERAAKTGATAEQLREANSINKSLSALGDVISALSSEQQFIPYRNNKLTMLMQDSLGGNAKTLMFVNISPADYNAEETIVSLTYASRVKLITNDASKNADNKEIARLKNIIAKLEKGGTIDEEDEEEGGA